MSDEQTRTLRAPCEHGFYDKHWEGVPGSNQYVVQWCPGGREIVIDYEAGQRSYDEIDWVNQSSDPLFDDWHNQSSDPLFVARTVIDAALGVTV